MMTYKAIGNKIIQSDEYDSFDVALCDVPEDAIGLLNKAHHLNNVLHKYTASARMFQKVEALPGFKWLN